MPATCCPAGARKTSNTIFSPAIGPARIWCFELKSHPPLASLGSFRDGWFYVQDPSTLLAPTLLGAQPGETILDLCAAPGGKTTFIAQLMNNQGKIIASDSEPNRLRLVGENCAPPRRHLCRDCFHFNLQPSAFSL